MDVCSQGVVWWSSVVRGLSGGLKSGGCLREFCPRKSTIYGEVNST